MTPDDFKRRTKAFALRGIRLAEALPKSMTAQVVAKQLLRCTTSVGANYRAACRAKSRADFIAKMRIVEEECDESLYWMELLVESGHVESGRLEDLKKEADEILSLVVASIRTARSRKQSPIPNPQSPIPNCGKDGHMKAAVFHGKDVGLKIEDIPVPQIGAGQILVKVAACGACHTDLHYIDHGVPTFKKPPIVLGHEASGTVEEVGAEVTNVTKGQRVLIPAVLTCGRCMFCRMGRENICAEMKMLGNHFDGAYAEYVAVPAKDVLDLPESIPLAEASIIADAISTPYHAVKNRARVQPGDRVVVFGCGGVGINAVQLAAAVGAYVIAVDINERKLEWAAEFGAAKTINAGQVERVSKEIKKLTGGGADIAMEVIGNPRTIEEAFECVRVGGRLCVVGYTHEAISVVAGKIMFKEIEVVGSLGCRPVDYVPLMRMVEQGRIDLKRLVTHRFSLDEIGQAFEVMKEGLSLRSIVVP